MLRTTLFSAAAAAALLAAPAAIAQTAPETVPAAATPAAAGTVIDVLKERGQFTTFLRALDQAQLTEVLATRPAITLFAPTDEAFAALPEADRTRLLDPANAQELRNLMLYHVIVTELTTDQIKGARGPVATGGGVEITIDGTGEAIAVGTAKVTQAEIDASNGGVFVIDAVLNPNAAPAAAPAAAGA
ncbi:fasciclin domain-containing protein [Brevundimonas sp.]|uniref:fasciclin domain-containing protein n=1 Tax=Brevundimonas sp. TaxID=1871086 RepID=UPI002EDB9DAA